MTGPAAVGPAAPAACAAVPSRAVTACRALEGVGFAAVVDGPGVVLSAAQATRLAAEVTRLRERLAAAEAAPY